ncbi:MAG: MBL fold metallo-hydrolase [Proteobacteria bacterium]|nr:MBL fold metallo-hydrolase [Pseudomonadota bacterium]
MIVKVLVVGPIGANCIILGCEKTRKAVVVDPGDEGDVILSVLAKDKLTVEHIINTHGHFDHVGANKRLKEVTGADILIHAKDAPMLGHLKEMAMAFGMRMENSPPADKLLSDGDIINFGEAKLKVLHTPGHSEGGISLLADDFVIAGDTLFQGSIGRTDLPGGDYKTLIKSIKTKLLSLGDNIKVYTGHGPSTLIGGEKRFNPFLQ